MKTKVVPFALGLLAIAACFSFINSTQAQSNLTIRVMSANITSGNGQSYETPGINIFQGLKPDVVAIQEFRYGGSSSDTQLRSLVDTAFGTNFSYFRESYTNGGDIPNGIVSRWPIVASGTWDDSLINNRGYAWARIALPGTNDLYVVSVHLFSGGTPADRNTEANEVKNYISANFPADAWVIVGGDFNTGSRGEAAVGTFKTFLSDDPIPTDAEAGGDPDTNAGRSAPYDYLLPSFSLTNKLVPVLLPSRTFTSGLVFDSRVYTPLTDVSPVVIGDSGVSGMQHMAVIKDFQITVDGSPATNPPSITVQPVSQTNSIGANVSFSVTATGTAPLAYQWRFYGTNISGATTNPISITNIQPTNAGNYTVVITNIAGSITSSVATLTVTTSPTISTNPQSQTVTVGGNATFTVVASGSAPLSYQWRFAGTNIGGANSTSYTRSNAQLVDAGNYTVVVTNSVGSVTSAVAVLTVNPPVTGSVIAQWNFNSTSPDALPSTGSTTPSVGTGTASLVTALTPSFASGSTNDPANAGTDNSGWNTTTYPAAAVGNKTAGVRFDVSTVGKQNLTVRWDQRVSNTGSKYSRLQYTTNGSTFIDFPSSVAVVTAAIFEARTNNLSALPGVNNNVSFGFRIVNEFEITATGSGASAYAGAASAYATTGTTRFDMVTLFGDSITVSNPPAITPTLTNAALVGAQFQFQLTGTTGSNYVVQATANLSPATWISLRTNAAPFTFVDSNVFALPQRFYRGMIAP